MNRGFGIRAVIGLCVLLAACSGDDETSEGGRGGSGFGGMSSMMGGPPGGEAAVPVEVTSVERRSISSFIETNGTLEAENEVDIVARVAGPIVRLEAEETMVVSRGDLLARIDPSEIEAQTEMSRVALDEARLAFERAERLKQDELVSAEGYDSAKAAFESAEAQYEGNAIQLAYTEIRAPFDGLIVDRYIKFAQHVSVGDRLFRISDFDPLLCRIQVPERNLSQLRKGQRAYLTVGAWPGERFEAEVLRLSPVVDAATGTVRVTLEVAAKGKLSPGMFASVYLETETRDGALVIPRAALALDSIGDTVYVAGDGAAERREVTLGFREGDLVEIVDGVAEGELVVSVGQDGLSDGTPIQVLAADGEAVAVAAPEGGDPSTMGGPGAGGPPAEPSAGPSGGRWGGERPDLSEMSDEQIEKIKERMRSFGMTDEQIDARLKAMREEQGGGESAGDG